MLNKKEDPNPPFTGPHRFPMKGWISCAPFERLLNIDIQEAAEGRAILALPFLVDFAQGAGLMHGGALVSLADTAVVMAIKSLIPPQSHFATIALEVKFLLPVKKGIVTARAKVVDRQGEILKGHATVYDEEGRAVMEFFSTFKIAKDTKIEGITFDDLVKSHRNDGCVKSSPPEADKARKT
jgi:acyl-CoA thioesterase